MITVIPSLDASLRSPFVMPPWLDKKIRVHDGDGVQILACQEIPQEGQPLLRVFGETVGLVLVDPSDPSASKFLTHIEGQQLAFATLGTE